MAPKRARASEDSSSKAQYDTQHGAHQPPTRDLQFTGIAHCNRCHSTWGFVTPIASRSGTSLRGLEEAKGRNRVDLTTCQTIKMITRMGDYYHLVLPNSKPSLQLPDPARLTI
ncbi:hypothetical protein Salat_1742900 [Sesamum alatum]|uniref:Uncharacterized protein n=1 Tax=Sesamum alatum TaxID=300844 RepID=A0AAE1Y8U2_9LAMI|nr:hypothetical protein Salat_1742900 [Sesamum alatum]